MSYPASKHKRPLSQVSVLSQCFCVCIRESKLWLAGFKIHNLYSLRNPGSLLNLLLKRDGMLSWKCSFWAKGFSNRSLCHVQYRTVMHDDIIMWRILSSTILDDDMHVIMSSHEGPYYQTMIHGGVTIQRAKYWTMMNDDVIQKKTY